MKKTFVRQKSFIHAKLLNRENLKNQGNDYMKTKKALAGLFGLLGSLAAALLRPAPLAGFLVTESLSPQKFSHKTNNDMDKNINFQRSNKKFTNRSSWNLLGAPGFSLWFTSFHNWFCERIKGSAKKLDKYIQISQAREHSILYIKLIIEKSSSKEIDTHTKSRWIRDTHKSQTSRTWKFKFRNTRINMNKQKTIT